MTNFDPYDTLGVDRDADDDTIRKAYKNAAKKAHPDGGGNAEAFHEVGRALAVLTDPERRKRFDETGKDEERVNLRKNEYNVLAELFDAIINHDDFTPKDNIVLLMQKLLNERLSRINEAILTVKVSRKKCKRIIKGLVRRKGKGGDALREIFNGKLHAIEESMADLQDQLSNHRKALNIVLDYDYMPQKDEPTGNEAESPHFPPKYPYHGGVHRGMGRF